MENTERKKGFWSLAGAAAALLFSWKWLLLIFKLLKLKTLISMAIYLGTYAFLYGWKFAIALVYLIFVHEMGHKYAAHKLKLPTSPAIFIPFMGAAIGLKEMPKNAKDEAYLAYMGPLFGLLSFLPAIPLFLLTQEPYWALFIFLGGMINLFNLIPITPLDGGRIAAGISTKLWAVGLILLLSFSIYFGSFLGFLITIIGAIEWNRIYKRQKNLHNEEKEVMEYCSINEQLQEHAKVASIGNFVYYANSIRSVLDNKELKESFNLLDNIDEYTEEEDQAEKNRLIIEEFLLSFNEQVNKIRLNYEQIASYYKTNHKTKWKLFLIYISLIIILAISTYFGNEIIMNSSEMQEMMGD